MRNVGDAPLYNARARRKMSPLENPRWEAFAQAIVRGLASDKPRFGSTTPDNGSQFRIVDVQLGGNAIDVCAYAGGIRAGAVLRDERRGPRMVLRIFTATPSK
jgi:hypothetical protein